MAAAAVVAEVSGEGGGEGRMDAMASMIRLRNCWDALSYRSKAIWKPVTTMFGISFDDEQGGRMCVTNKMRGNGKYYVIAGKSLEYCSH